MDPIADMLTRIRNGAQVKKSNVDLPYSKIKEEILKILQLREFIASFEVLKRMERRYLRINLKYGARKKSVFSNLQRVSTPGRRVYVQSHEIPRPLSGYGVAILSTTRGILADDEARRLKLGGEIICYVW